MSRLGRRSLVLICAGLMAGLALRRRLVQTLLAVHLPDGYSNFVEIRANDVQVGDFLEYAEVHAIGGTYAGTHDYSGFVQQRSAKPGLDGLIELVLKAAIGPPASLRLGPDTRVRVRRRDS